MVEELGKYNVQKSSFAKTVLYLEQNQHIQSNLNMIFIKLQNLHCPMLSTNTNGDVKTVWNEIQIPNSFFASQFLSNFLL